MTILPKLVKYDNDEYLPYKRVIDYIIQKCDYTSPASNFQMFLTPPGTYTVNLGYAATNNPLETHNNTLKTVVSARQLLTLPVIINELMKYLRVGTHEFFYEFELS